MIATDGHGLSRNTNTTAVIRTMGMMPNQRRKRFMMMMNSRFSLGFALGVPHQSCFGADSTTCTIKLFFSCVAGIVDPGCCAAVAGVVLSAVASTKADDPGASAAAGLVVFVGPMID